MVEITFKVLVSLVLARKWPLYLVLCFSFMASVSFRQVWYIFSIKGEAGATLVQILIFLYDLLLFLVITNKYVLFINSFFLLPSLTQEILPPDN